MPEDTKIETPQGETPVIEDSSLAPEGAVGIGPLEGEDIQAEVSAPDAIVPAEPQATPLSSQQAQKPVEAITPVPLTSSTPPPIAPEIQSYIGRLEEQKRVADEQNDQRVLQEAIKGYAQQLEDQHGFTPEQALMVAQQQGNLLYRQYRQEKFHQQQMNDALEISQQYGIDPRTLMPLPTRQAMQEVAKAATERGKEAKRIQALEAENAALKKAQVPGGQKWDSGSPGAASPSSREAIRDRYIDGKPVTEREKAILFPNR